VRMADTGMPREYMVWISGDCIERYHVSWVHCGVKLWPLKPDNRVIDKSAPEISALDRRKERMKGECVSAWDLGVD